MKKDIYIIKNDINNKSYIGQAVNVQQRFQSHKKPSSAILSNSIIDKAIQKYGARHFYVEILESQIENYDEREQYWIAYYNTLVPNGYNILPGGQNPPYYAGSDHPESILIIEDIEALTNDLKNSDLSFTQLANKYGFKSRTSVMEFNQGKTYHRDISYPIRTKCYIGKLTDEDVDEIYQLLLNTNLTYTQIATQFGVEYRAISRIDKGIFHRRDSFTYPLRRKNK